MVISLITEAALKLLSIAARLFDSGEHLPKVSILGATVLRLATPIIEDYEEERLDCRCHARGSKFENILVRERPNVIVTAGDPSAYRHLQNYSVEIRKRWLHFDTLPERSRLGTYAYDRYLENLFSSAEGDETPLVTVFTPTYKTGDKIWRAFRSLKQQTYTNWEWVLVDDSDDNGNTFKMLSRLAKEDHRISVFKPWEHSGVIGKVKNWACSLGKGALLVELDHDDELTDDALDRVVKGFGQFPEAGFLYTDSAEVLEDGTSHTYRDGWAFGYGSYSDVEYKGKLYKSANSPNINAKTIRHIVSAPNHLRAWRTSFYQAIGGHNRELHVADDYEIVVRTFLGTRMVRVPKLCYIQHMSNQTAQSVRNGDIHRHVRSIRMHYDKRIHDRLLDLGCPDFIWNEETGTSDLMVTNPEHESHVTWLAVL
jgi:O-antigen biosynthesis protein